MRKFRLATLLLPALVLTSGLVGCGEKPVAGDFKPIDEIIAEAKALVKEEGEAAEIEKTAEPNFVVPEGGYDGSEVTIKFYHTMGQNLRDVLDKYIVEFNKLYPNITIQHEQTGSYNDVRDQIKTEITVGNQPNLAYCYPDHVALYNLAGAVAHLDNLIDSTIEVTRADDSKEILGLTSEQKSDFIEGYYNEGRQFGDGLMYSIPFSKSTEVLYYNETYFTANNISVPNHWFSESEEDTTSMEYVCKKIKELDPDSTPLGVDSAANWFITMTEQTKAPYTSAKGDHFLFDNPTNKGIAKRFREWYQKGWMTTQGLYGAYTSGLFTKEKTEEDKTISYMSIGSSAGATHQRPTKTDAGYPFNVGIAAIPQMNQQRRKVISQGPAVTIFNKSNPQEVIASWLFVKYLTTSVRFQVEFSNVSGYLPVIKSVQDNQVFKDKMALADGGDYIAQLSTKACMEQADAYYTSPAFNGSSTARDQVENLYNKIFPNTSETEAEIESFINGAFRDAIYECEYSL